MFSSSPPTDGIQVTLSCRMFADIRAAVRKIPKGRVATYGAVARAAGYPGAARQVAWALRGLGGRLPWHRVLGAGGTIRLPREAGAEQKLRLRMEGHEFRFRGK